MLRQGSLQGIEMILTFIESTNVGETGISILLLIWKLVIIYLNQNNNIVLLVNFIYTVNCYVVMFF